VFFLQKEYTMPEYLSFLGSISWWISAVVVGILINIVAYYLIRIFDKQLSSISKRWKIRSDAQKAKTLEELENLINNPSEQNFYAHAETRHRLMAIYYMVYSLFMLIFVLLGEVLVNKATIKGIDLAFPAKLIFITVILISGLSMFIALYNRRLAEYLKDLLDASRRGSEK
jgi:uncharacterized membrane protein (UPF0182 family)